MFARRPNCSGARHPAPTAGKRFSPASVAGGKFPAPVAGIRKPAPVAGGKLGSPVLVA